MAIEVYQSTYDGNFINEFDREGLELAQFFSASPHFTIIDSFTTHWWSNRDWDGVDPDPPAVYTTHRHKGDPITDSGTRPSGPGGTYNIWHDLRDVGQTNDWIVIQCETTIHGSYGLPKWQCKIQWTNSTAFDDVSGLDYSLEGDIRFVAVRFSPHGGWDLEDVNPDFSPAGQSYSSSQNHNWYVGHRGSGDDTKWFFVVDDGQLLRFSRRDEKAYDMMNFAGFMGDITPVSGQADQPTPRAILTGEQADLTQVGTNTMFPEDIGLGGSDDPDVGFTGNFGFEDETGNWVTSQWTLPDGERLINYNSQPNRHASSFELDVIPYFLISATKGIVGTCPLIGRAYMPGFMLIASKSLLCWKAGYGLLCKWDGVTDLNF